MISKLYSKSRARARRLKLGARGKKVVFTNGCFDLIHSGHAIYLDKARQMGDFLVVGLNSDKSVRRLKGPGRPIMNFKERAILLSYLSPVDMVVGFDDDTPLDLIKYLRPDILAKGADYKISEIVGATEVKRWGGKVRRISLVKGKSSSNLIKKIK